MIIVVDTNIIFSALLASSASVRTHLSDDRFRFVAPNYLFVELFLHKERLISLTRLDEPELLEYIGYLFDRIHFVDAFSVSDMSKKSAFALCCDVDEKDTPMVALTIDTGGMLWTGDKKLKAGLRKKGFNRFFVPV